MWTKSDHNGLTTNALCKALHLVEDGLMAEVDTVEGADGDHGVWDVSGFYYVSKDFHECLNNKGLLSLPSWRRNIRHLLSAKVFLYAWEIAVNARNDG